MVSSKINNQGMSAEMFATYLNVTNFPFNEFKKGSRIYFEIMFRWKCDDPIKNTVVTLQDILIEMERSDIVEDIRCFDKSQYRVDTEFLGCDEEVSDSDFRTLEQRLSTDYIPLVRFLGLPHHIIQQIEADYSNSIRKRIFMSMKRIATDFKPLRKLELCNGLVYISRKDVIDALHHKWNCVKSTLPCEIPGFSEV
ncbi:uncharacterized protein LOC130049722 [Ostrea edulis]|uniref:uncharacterized protein LOC130049722 n=1 Tax=Ostrea edulis TaxID=37623 RepID=UPI0024AEBC15|nr:uncharacterized protein LOC130049722 [Ostrea edulis]